MDANGFERLLDQLRAFTPRAEVVLEEVPAPQKLATFAFAFSADVSNGKAGDEEDELASGRFVLLHEPGGQDTWEGEFRCVTFVRADVDTAMQEDPMLPEFGWGWFLSALEAADCRIAAPSGTVTRVSSASFGKLSPRNNESEIEIRASWTPVISNPNEIIAHITGWCNLISEVAGLEEIPPGISTIASARSR
ncbi:unannotated protein [freshwater metagenome]|uniref:Unannotated protein n=1 Tax=freshwater metagenome TaxID=449393 RepID=A0A6J7LZD9_9ZZZZ|nr:DUF3000 family protein [Actinomycetota bacterium]MSW62870.1 DUF3000 family protein [Actinomycetota bacterium]MSX89638.1 DUF3000 family protein [Actinomycetota bacterium]MSZ63616.1 DUF3000 family protein [Actinomycetota bacterium]MTA57767.1 DUF3000 family protein [Actinomycetota bacterium]